MKNYRTAVDNKWSKSSSVFDRQYMLKCSSRTTMRLLLALIVVVGLWITIAPAHAKDEDPITLVYATYMSNGATATKIDTWFMDEVERRSHGRIQFERYYAGSLLGAVDIFPGLAKGVVDIASGAPSGYNRKQYPLSTVVLPYITNKADAVTYALGELYKVSEPFRSEYEDKGIKLLWGLAYPNGHIWGNYTPKGAFDVKGKRIRALFPLAPVIDALGGVVVSMPYTPAVQAYMKGALDGVTNIPFDSGVTSGLDQASEFVTDAGHMGVYAMSSTGINMQSFNALPEDLQNIILQVAREVPHEYAQIVQKRIQQAAKTLVARSPELTIFRTDTRRDDLAKMVQQKWLNMVSDNELEMQSHLEMLNTYIALVRKYEKTSTYVPGLEAVQRLLERNR